MPLPRKAQVHLGTTPYYHCMSRCVRRAFLCGYDSMSCRDYEHRRQWIEDQLLDLPRCFSIDVCAYAVMSNHFHVVLHVNGRKATKWSSLEVIQRWHELFKGTLLTQRFARDDKLSSAELNAVGEVAEQWRERLSDISWFMRVLNERIARQANAEDRCTGRFWEGRFKCQALLDEKALAACLAYVDLNPIRSKMADRPENSSFTSAKRRIDALSSNRSKFQKPIQPTCLLPFAGNPRKDMPEGLPFRLTDYLELLDWTGRVIREDKRGFIPSNLPPILTRLQIAPDNWLSTTQHFESRFRRLVGGWHALKRCCQELGYQRTPGLSGARLLS
ncbi:transposase [Proteobacteria bacterium 005FR1]|nr:transposase [Proteobacteria bacterium 005FR1]